MRQENVTVNTRNRRQNMVHVDGDDYTYDGICTADQHQAEQDAKIAWLQILWHQHGDS